MRKVTLSLLAFLTFLPSLVCFMTVCPMKSAQAGETMNCHESMSQDGTSDVESFMLVQDCLGVDLFQQSDNPDYIPDFTVLDIDFSNVDIAFSNGLENGKTNAIRGPPPTTYLAQLGQHTYFTTQRIRI